MKFLRYAWLTSIATLIFQALYYYPRLPDRIASHFNSSGSADSTAPLTEFYLAWFLAITVVNIIPALLGPLLRTLPPRLINTPNRDYWLADNPRREQFIAITRTMLAGPLLGANLLLIIVFQFTAGYNLNQPTVPYEFIYIGVPVELLLSLISIVWGLTRLNNIPAASPPPP